MIQLADADIGKWKKCELQERLVKNDVIGMKQVTPLSNEQLFTWIDDESETEENRLVSFCAYVERVMFHISVSSQNSVSLCPKWNPLEKIDHDSTENNPKSL